jgi:hypothetical protein
MVQVDSINDLPGYNEPKPGYSELITKTVLKIAIKIANNAKKKIKILFISVEKLDVLLINN